MAASVFRDLVSELQSQVASLQSRIEELELENERLQSQLSSCRLSEEEDTNLPPIGCRNHEGSVNEVHEGKSCVATKKPVSAISSFTRHLVISSDEQVKQDGSEPTFSLAAENMNHETTSSQIGRQDCNQRIQNVVKRYVALKIMYFGKRFYGFASEAQKEPTVESEIFKALLRTKLLIGNKQEWHYSRCGRTDKGVSSSGQVIALYLRSKLKDLEENVITQKTILDEKYEIDYVKVLNRVLPRDIRVIGWCPVPTDFHARFSCLKREYKYLFWKGNLDIPAMQKAAEKFIGEFDFRNFCKMDAINVSNYTRRITSFRISPCSMSCIQDELWEMTIKGSAFLWHQVRCMVAVLFMIGQLLESPEVIDVLLDTKMVPTKPQYNMAAELPLILHSCEFENLEFICSSDAQRALHDHLYYEFQDQMLKAAIFHEALTCISNPGAHEHKFCSLFLIICLSYGSDACSQRFSIWKEEDAVHSFDAACN